MWLMFIIRQYQLSRLQKDWKLSSSVESTNIAPKCPVSRARVPLLKEPFQIAIPKPLQWKKDQEIPIGMKVKEKLEKVAIA